MLKVSHTGFEVNFMDDVGQTLLNWASAFGTQEMVRNLCVCVCLCLCLCVPVHVYMCGLREGAYVQIVCMIVLCVCDIGTGVQNKR